MKQSGTLRALGNYQKPQRFSVSVFFFFFFGSGGGDIKVLTKKREERRTILKADLLVFCQNSLSLFGLVSYLWELKNLGCGAAGTH